MPSSRAPARGWDLRLPTPTSRPAPACCCARAMKRCSTRPGRLWRPRQRQVRLSRQCGADVSSPTDVARLARQALAAVSAGPRPREQCRHLRPHWVQVKTSIGTSGCARWRSTCTARCSRAGRCCRISNSTVRQNRSTVGRRRHEPSATHQRLRCVEGRNRAVCRVARARSQTFHIDVNAIAPGALNTRMLDEVLAAGPDAVGRDFHDRMVKTKEQGGTPLERGAALAVYLGSSSSDGITGRLLSAVWDPWEQLADHRDDLDAQRCLHAAPNRAEGPRLHVGGPLNPPPGVAIVGCGLIGRKRAAALAGARLVACADTEPARAMALAPECRARSPSIAGKTRSSPRRRYRDRGHDE